MSSKVDFAPDNIGRAQLSHLYHLQHYTVVRTSERVSPQGSNVLPQDTVKTPEAAVMEAGPQSGAI